MSDFRPDTEDIRDHYIGGRMDTDMVTPEQAEAEFNGWLAQHDAEVAERERRRLAKVVRLFVAERALIESTSRLEDVFEKAGL